MSLYACREMPGAGYTLTKLDLDLNPEAVYEVTNATCTCPAGPRPTCKHRSRLLPAFLLHKHVDDGWLLNDLNMMWHRPLTEDRVHEIAEHVQACNEVLDLITEAQVPTGFRRRV